MKGLRKITKPSVTITRLHAGFEFWTSLYKEKLQISGKE
jgi:hypothetical protein